MNLLSRYLDDAYIAWLSGAVCCASNDREGEDEKGSNRGMVAIIFDSTFISVLFCATS